MYFPLFLMNSGNNNKRDYRTYIRSVFLTLLDRSTTEWKIIILLLRTSKNQTQRKEKKKKEKNSLNGMFLILNNFPVFCAYD